MQMCFLLAFLLTATAAAQVPGDGSNFAPSAPREIKTLYYELFQTTEIWVRLVPVDQNRKPAPLSLIFYVTFSGKKLESVPAEVTVRGQADPRFVASKFSLNLRPQPGDALNLVGPLGTIKNAIGTKFQFYPNCPVGDDCAVTGVISYLPWQTFLQVTQSRALTAEILGTEVSFEQGDFDALKTFAKMLSSGKQ
jgi:hypothetical protein